MGTRFNATALDELLNDTLTSTEQIHNDLLNNQEHEEELIQEPQVSPQINKLINQNNGATVDYSRVYAQLEKLIENGNVALQVLGAIDPDVSGMEVAASTASLMNAIKNCIAEFTKIHLQHIKFQQALHLEQVKHKHKLQELQVKKQIIEAKNKNNSNIMDINTNDNTTDNNTMIPWKTQGINSYLQYLASQNKGE